MSLAGGSDEGDGGSEPAVLLWLVATGVAAVAMLTVGRRAFGPAVAFGLAGGLLFSIGDVSTELATQGGARFAFASTLVLGYLGGTALLQLGYQAGGARPLPASPPCWPMRACPSRRVRSS